MTSDAPTQDASRDDAQTATPDASSPVALQSFVYVSGWGAAYPVKTYALNRDSGGLSELNSSAAFGDSPSFIAARGARLYLTNESDAQPTVTGASIDSSTALPSKLEARSYDKNGGFVHASLDAEGKFLFAASYNGGRLVGFPIGQDGELGPAINSIEFGNGAQTHSSVVHPNGKWVYAPNKGLDVIGQLSLDANSGQLTRRADFETDASGPRMIALSPNGKYAYVMYENVAIVDAFSIGVDGLLTRIDTEDAPPGVTGKAWGAHALVHPNGKFLYTSERTTSTLSVFAIGDDGKLTHLAETPTEGNGVPRCFDIDAQGAWMVVANQGNNDSGNAGSLIVFAIGNDGKLSKRGPLISGLKAPTAVSIVTRPNP